MFSDRFARSMERLLREIQAHPEEVKRLGPGVAKALIKYSEKDPDRTVKDIYARRHPQVRTKQD